mgnify:CR=1 FL=1
MNLKIEYEKNVKEFEKYDVEINNFLKEVINKEITSKDIESIEKIKNEFIEKGYDKNEIKEYVTFIITNINKKYIDLSDIRVIISTEHSEKEYLIKTYKIIKFNDLDYSKKLNVQGDGLNKKIKETLNEIETRKEIEKQLKEKERQKELQEQKEKEEQKKKEEQELKEREKEKIKLIESMTLTEILNTIEKYQKDIKTKKESKKKDINKRFLDEIEAPLRLFEDAINDDDFLYDNRNLAELLYFTSEESYDDYEPYINRNIDFKQYDYIVSIDNLSLEDKETLLEYKAEIYKDMFEILDEYIKKL